MYKKALEEGLDASRKFKAMAKDAGYLHPLQSDSIRRHDYRQTFDNYLGDQIQIELVVIGKYNKDNGGIYWILTAIVILSRYTFAIPVYWKDTSNMTKAVTLLLEQFKDQLGDCA